MTAALTALHALAATLWVGGMLFAHLCLRPAALALDPPARLSLMAGALGRFFPMVAGSILVLLASGYGLVAKAGGFAGLGLHIHLMQGIGLVMMALFGHLYFASWPRLRRAVAAQEWPAGAAALGQIRRIVTINLVLGLLVVAIGASGRWWG
jgi:uncharacterized membrane protein